MVRTCPFTRTVILDVFGAVNTALSSTQSQVSTRAGDGCLVFTRTSSIRVGVKMLRVCSPGWGTCRLVRSSPPAVRKHSKKGSKQMPRIRASEGRVRLTRIGYWRQQEHFANTLPSSLQYLVAIRNHPQKGC